MSVMEIARKALTQKIKNSRPQVICIFNPAPSQRQVIVK